jgi:hypothetical protein
VIRNVFSERSFAALEPPAALGTSPDTCVTAKVVGASVARRPETRAEIGTELIENPGGDGHVVVLTDPDDRPADRVFTNAKIQRIGVKCGERGVIEAANEFCRVAPVGNFGKSSHRGIVA